MAFTIGTGQLDYTDSRRTERVVIDSPHQGEVSIEIFRSKLRVYSNGEFYLDADDLPIRLMPQALAVLAEYCEIPPQLAAAIPDKQALARLFVLLPALIQIAADGADRKQRQSAGES
jgi:deoxycytidine triphosphate deaminase